MQQESPAQGAWAGPAARRVREDCELLRATPRHGTRLRLSAVSVEIVLLSLSGFAALVARADHLTAMPI